MAYESWHQYSKIKHHRGFAKLAHLVGQDHHSDTGFPIASLVVALSRLGARGSEPWTRHVAWW